MASRLCTLSVTDPAGPMPSVDVVASSTFDAAHLYLRCAKGHPDALLPVPTRDTAFEIEIGGTVYTVHGSALKQWVEWQWRSLNGPKGMLFRKRPQLDQRNLTELYE